ncbi:MAG: class I SAM-dependent methyltransferase [Tepidisphaeraceae bacterium]
MPQTPNNPWDTIAPYWDEQVGEGNDFQKQLIFPTTDRLLTPKAGERILDACCGNGGYARRLGRMGCDVLAFDGSAAFVEIAKSKTKAVDDRIEYRHLDACDASALRTLNDQSFDAVVCSMALMDLPTIDPLVQAVRRVLKQGGRFVWSVGHPCFHTNEAVKVGTQIDGEGEPVQTFGCLVTRYKTDWIHESRGLLNQPVSHTMWHRSIGTLMQSSFEAGFVVDGFAEPSFEPDTRARSPFSWARRPEIPPVLVVRCR